MFYILTERLRIGKYCDTNSPYIYKECPTLHRARHLNQ